MRSQEKSADSCRVWQLPEPAGRPADPCPPISLLRRSTLPPLLALTLTHPTHPRSPVSRLHSRPGRCLLGHNEAGETGLHSARKGRPSLGSRRVAGRACSGQPPARKALVGVLTTCPACSPTDAAYRLDEEPDSRLPAAQQRRHVRHGPSPALAPAPAGASGAARAAAPAVSPACVCRCRVNSMSEGAHSSWPAPCVCSPRRRRPSHSLTPASTSRCCSSVRPPAVLVFSCCFAAKAGEERNTTAS